ncbi:CerR family C-terminal domain-containing protein [soil metagenome]
MVVAEDTKERLLLAAGQVFAEKGFQAATIREISQKAEANVAAINYHFGDKEQLYIEAVRTAHKCRGDAYPLPEWTPETSSATRLSHFIENLLQRMLGEGEAEWHHLLLMREMMQPTEAVAALIREGIRPHFEILLAILAEIMPEGTPELELRFVGLSIVGQCFAYRTGRPIVEGLLGPAFASKLTREQLTQNIVRFSLAALGLTPPLNKESTP